jgi:hypothetical protein
MTTKQKRARPAAQSEEAAEKVKAAKDPKAAAPAKSEAKTKGDKPPKSDHDQLEEIRASFVKIAKVEQEIEDLRGQVKTKRERLKTLTREHRFLLQGQGALPFGARREELDTTSPEWFDVHEIGTNRFVAKLKVGDPHLDDYRKRPKDFVVRPGVAPAAGDLQDAANRERADWAAGGKGPRPIDKTDNKSKAAGEGLRSDASAE